MPTKSLIPPLTRFGIAGLLCLARPAAAQVRFSSDWSGLEALKAGTARLAELGVELGHRFAAQAARLDWLGTAGVQLSIGGDGALRSKPPAGWDAQDPADSLYRAARSELNRGNYTQAAYLFNRIHDRFAKSTYAGDAYYWEAFARYREGSGDGLKTALRLIEVQLDKYPDAATRDDASALAQRIRGQLARGGDSRAAAEVREAAERVGADQSRERASMERERAAADRERARSDRERSRESRSRCRDDDDDEKMAALNALLQMDEDRALPILKKVMGRRDAGSVCLRRKAVFLISQHSGSEAETMLLAAVRGDPDSEVREQAVFWLSQVNSEHAAQALDSILRSSDDPVVQEKAIFALSQHSSERAMRSLRDYAIKADAPKNLRENAIFWLGQSGDNGTFLKSLYKSVKDEALKEKVIFSIAQRGSRENQRWLIDVAADAGEDVEIRKKAIFWAGQSGVPLPELFGLYDRTPEREIREGLIFAYSQRSERAAVDKLVQIAKTEKDKELRKNAMFWLSQSNDPRVAEILDEILNK